MINILIVEDDKDIVEILKSYIKDCQEDLVIDTTSYARIAIKNLEDKYYDIVITDMGIDDHYLGGCSVVDKAKEVGTWSVLFSGIHHNDCSPNYVLPKPFENEDLKCMFQKWQQERYKISSHYKVIQQKNIISVLRDLIS